MGLVGCNRMLKTVHSFLFDALAGYMRPRLRAKGLRFPERVYGNLQSGRMSEAYFLYALDNLRADCSEIYFHPAVYESSSLLSAEQRQGQLEFEALLSKRVLERIRSLGIGLTNYYGLEGSG